jgi:hypothetical protein
VDKTKTTEAIHSYPDALEIRQFDASIVANYHVLNMAASINQRPQLSASFMGQFSQLPREFRRHNLVRSDAPGIEFGYSAELILLESGGVS